MKKKPKISKNISNYLFLNNLKYEISNKDVSYFSFKFIRNKQIIKDLKEIEIN